MEKTYNIEFECIDCGSHVFAWGSPIQRLRCAVCQWIFTQPNLTPEQIDEIRVITNTPVREDGI